jgi:uncharacterized protein with HEPN domain
MHPKCLKWLNDIVEGCDVIETAAAGRSLADYETDRILRSAIERNFEIIGEAFNRIVKLEPSLAEKVPDFRAIISFRNVLIHGYDYVDHSRVWQIIQKDVPPLRDRIAALVKEPGQKTDAQG